MLARLAVRSISRVSVAAKPSLSQVRFGHHDAHHDTKPKFVLNADGVVVPEIVDTLEWVLEIPVNIHQFDEPPIVVEIEHLENLKVSGEDD